MADQIAFRVHIGKDAGAGGGFASTFTSRPFVGDFLTINGTSYIVTKIIHRFEQTMGNGSGFAKTEIVVSPETTPESIADAGLDPFLTG